MHKSNHILKILLLKYARSAYCVCRFGGYTRVGKPPENDGYVIFRGFRFPEAPSGNLSLILVLCDLIQGLIEVWIGDIYTLRMV